MWNSDPAEARTVFGLVGSTVPWQQTTASTPAASAVRIMVPTLPGSRTSMQTTTIPPPPGRPGRPAAKATTATTGCGVTVSVTRPMTPGARSKTRAPEAKARSTTALTAGLVRPSGATYTDSTGTPAAKAAASSSAPSTTTTPSEVRRLRLRRSCRSRRTRRWVDVSASWLRNRPRPSPGHRPGPRWPPVPVRRKPRVR